MKPIKKLSQIKVGSLIRWIVGDRMYPTEYYGFVVKKDYDGCIDCRVVCSYKSIPYGVIQGTEDYVVRYFTQEQLSCMINNGRLHLVGTTDIRHLIKCAKISLKNYKKMVSIISEDVKMLEAIIANQNPVSQVNIKKNKGGVTT